MKKYQNNFQNKPEKCTVLNHVLPCLHRGLRSIGFSVITFITWNPFSATYFPPIIFCCYKGINIYKDCYKVSVFRNSFLNTTTKLTLCTE